MKPTELHKHIKVIHKATEQLLVALETEMIETEANDNAARERADAVEQAKRELRAEQTASPVAERIEPNAPAELPQPAVEPRVVAKR